MNPPDLGELLRVEGGRVLATLIRVTGDIDLAEDALQDAVVVALERWRTAGIPESPGAWLTTVARNRALDRLRREAKRRQKETEALLSFVPNESDDRLQLIFTCCHPALSLEARVALTLRLIGGLTAADIARLFLQPEATVAQRITRAKKKIAVVRIPYRIPQDSELPDRMVAVLAVIYLIFTGGHHAHEGALDSRTDLAVEGIRLGRMLALLMPDDAEAQGLLALMLSTHARRRARLDAEGNLVLMAHQDRSQWDHAAIAQAAGLVERALRRRRPGPYQIQAAVSCLHGLAPNDEETDWPQILALYDLLESRHPGPVVTVNRAVALSKVNGPQAALAGIAHVTGLENWHLFWATKADFLRQLGEEQAAAESYRRALELDMNDTDRRFLAGRLASLDPR
ncbi:RNA polymerase sigma factor [soil metagenome]